MIQLTAKPIFDSDVLGTVWRHRCSLDRWKVPSFITANQVTTGESPVLEPTKPPRSAVAHGIAALASLATPPAHISNPHSARQIA